MVHFLIHSMKKGLKKILSYFPEFMQEFIEMIFNGSAEYHLRISKLGKQKYRSYTQLKRHQKNVRRALALVVLMVLSGFGGMLVGPVFFPRPAESEVYIPNGKGDILVSNVSRNQATVIFKTLDGANGNRPLATRSVVEFYEDDQYKDLARRITEDEYAVTHIVAADSLQEGKIYYIKITAEDSALPAHKKTVDTWGSHDQIRVFTTGELIPSCAVNEPKEIPTEIVESKKDLEIISTSGSGNDDEQFMEASLGVDNVLNENHLQPGNKVQTIISWTTNIPSSTILAYEEQQTGQQKEIVISEDLVTKHAAVLTNLKPGSIYYFSVKSKDAQGNLATSEEYSLKTPRPQENIIQKISNNFKGLLYQIKPR